jgi:hypothetical protein
MTEIPPIEPVRDIRMWIEQETIHLKVINDPRTDPIELAEHEAEAVIQALQSLLNRIRGVSNE